MFDRTTIMPQSVRDIHATVHEHRAPTADSVRFLKELEQAAEAKLLEAVAVESNGFSCVLHAEVEHISDRVFLKAIFDLNGRKMSAEVSEMRFKLKSQVDLIMMLIEEMGRVIAKEILAPEFSKLRLPALT